jgi:hypothetical protein
MPKFLINVVMAGGQSYNKIKRHSLIEGLIRYETMCLAGFDLWTPITV